MSKAFGITLVVVAIWAGIEVYTEGMSGAFGGIFQKFGVAEAPADPSNPAMSDKPLDALRFGVGEDMKTAEDKRRRAMGE